MTKIIDGKAISAAVKERVKKGVGELNQQGITVGLAVIIVGEDPASKVYVANKKKACEALGIISEEYALPESTTEAELLSLIKELNAKKSINGILCQLPLPRHLDEKLIINSILPEKDVDAFHPHNVGRIMIGDYDFVPCTPAGVMEMLEYENIAVEGKNCVVIGRSNIVGKPLASLLLNNNCTVTVVHSKTQDIAAETRQADIVIAACGCPKMVKASWIKEGAVLIDVGINRIDGKLCGDIDFDDVKGKAAYITPVPGGVGPMTIAMLLENTFEAFLQQNGLKK